MRRGSRPALLLCLLALAGCSSTTRLFHPGGVATTATPAAHTETIPHQPSAESVYLAQLGGEQARLAAAESRIPTSPRTPAQLRRSIELLEAAVRGLVNGLAGIHAPAAVATQHAHLISIMRAYAGTLAQAARQAVAPGGEPSAAELLLSATGTASQAFTATINQIDSIIGNSPG
jgi:hypothetical protein